MKTVATASAEIGPAQRGLMPAAQKVILGIAADIDALPLRPARQARHGRADVRRDRARLEGHSGPDKWDYWPLIEVPIDEVRQRLNILPKA